MSYYVELSQSKAAGVPWRRSQLTKIARMLEEETDRIVEALHKDLKKCKLEAIVHEISQCQAEAGIMLSNLSSWTQHQAVATPLAQVKGLSKSYIQYQPLGTVLIIAPWNYPFQLAINPLLGAIAAGNCAVIKPSELTPAVSELLVELAAKWLDADCIRVVTGGVDVSTELLRHKWDHIFFTGSPNVGRIVMRAAAEHLTPVTLELGGKSPCIVSSTADLATAARRIIWGKFSNAGQTCIAPDYVVVVRSIEEKLVAALKATLRQFYGENPEASPDFGRIISASHFQRLERMLDDPSVSVAIGGKRNPESLYIAPTLLLDVKRESVCMQEEIFGPVLPIITVDSIPAALDFVRSIPGKPLAFYLFSTDGEINRHVIESTTSGSLVVNDCVCQFANTNLPFGGVGNSGMGSYHGRFSFEAFSHKRAVMDKSNWFDLDLRYPPYTESKLKALRSVLCSGFTVADNGAT